MTDTRPMAYIVMVGDFPDSAWVDRDKAIAEVDRLKGADWHYVRWQFVPLNRSGRNITPSGTAI